jgi:uncharacterized protein
MNAPLRVILRELRTELEVLYAGRLVDLILFGSQARGDARPDFYIDVLIVLKPPMDSGDEIQRTSLPTSELCLRYNVLISRVFMDESRFLRRESPLLRNIEREGIAV